VTTPEGPIWGPAQSVPTVILCGGRGTRISEVNSLAPKPLLPIGGRPILWHIMKIYATYGHTDFVLALGWLGEEIRRFFLHYHALTSDFTLELGKPDDIEYLNGHAEEQWRVTCIDTGRAALTGTRVLRATRHLDDGPVMVTYGDSVGPVNITDLLAHHRAHGRLATVTAVRPPGRFGELVIGRGGVISEFAEKPQTTAGFINGGFMVFEKEAIDRYIPTDADVMLEREPLGALAADGQLVAYEHDGFWQPMDTPRERALLEDLWASGAPPWRIWN
jgi:glucose-1-phosphate cytidylyltransferase